MENKQPTRVGLSINWTSNSFEAKIDSRLVSAIDGLLGAFPRLWASKVEAWEALHRAKTENRRKIEAAASDRIVAEIKYHQSADICLEIIRDSMDEQAIEKLENRFHIVDRAIEIISGDKSIEEDVASENAAEDGLTPEFISQFSRYAEGATTDEVRDRLAQVLVAEIRKPGTFSPRVLRIIDEIDPDVARFYADLSKYRIGSYVPLAFVNVSEATLNLFDESGLIVKSFTGRVVVGGATELNSGARGYSLKFDKLAFFLGEEVVAKLQNGIGENIHLNVQDSVPVIEVIEPTKAGVALFEVMEDNSFSNALKLLHNLKSIDPSALLLQPSNIGDGTWAAYTGST